MRRSYNTNVAFLDLLFNTLLCFAALFVISFVLVNPVSEDGKIDVYADFLITVSWPQDITDDIDVYIQDPEGAVVYFGNKETNLMHLDRDDLGGSHDSIRTEFGVIEYSENREIVTIRKVIPGEYIVNLHIYSKRSSELAAAPIAHPLDARFRRLLRRPRARPRRRCGRRRATGIILAAGHRGAQRLSSLSGGQRPPFAYRSLRSCSLCGSSVRRFARCARL